MIIARRFHLLCKTTLCPSCHGAQQRLGCQEQILSLRLLIDIIRKSTLFITFIDNQIGYKVNREKLLELFHTKGWDITFMKAVRTSLQLHWSHWQMQIWCYHRSPERNLHQLLSLHLLHCMTDSATTHRTIYLTVNSTPNISPVYGVHLAIPEHHSVAFSRFRHPSRNLCIERER